MFLFCQIKLLNGFINKYKLYTPNKICNNLSFYINIKTPFNNKERFYGHSS